MPEADKRRVDFALSGFAVSLAKLLECNLIVLRAAGGGYLLWVGDRRAGYVAEFAYDPDSADELTDNQWSIIFKAIRDGRAKAI